MQTLFRDYLNREEEPKGPDVLALQLWLRGLGYRHVDPDGEYGPKTAAAVRSLQIDLGFATNEADGSFGPKTREKVLRIHGINFHSIPLLTEFSLMAEPVMGTA